MASIINLTPQQPVSVGPINPVPALGVRQNLWESVDISGFDILDLELVITQASLTGSAKFYLATGMQTQTEDGWVTKANGTDLALSGAAPGPSSIMTTFDKGLLRYVRWSLVLGGTSDTATFYIRGMARRYGTP